MIKNLLNMDLKNLILQTKIYKNEIYFAKAGLSSITDSIKFKVQ